MALSKQVYCELNDVKSSKKKEMVRRPKTSELLAIEREQEKACVQLRKLQRAEKQLRLSTYGYGQSMFYPRRVLSSDRIPGVRIGGGLSNYPVTHVPFDGTWCEMHIDGAWRIILDHPLAEMTVKEITARFYRPKQVDGVAVAAWSFPVNTPTCISNAITHDDRELFDYVRAPCFYSKRYWAQRRLDDIRCETNSIVAQFARDARTVVDSPTWVCKHQLSFPYVGEDVVDAVGEAQFSIDVNLIPPSMVNSLLQQAQPVLRDLAEKLETMKTTGMWMRIVLEAFFAMCHMYQADWSGASVFTSVSHFLLSLPVVATVQTKLLEWSLEFISSFVAAPVSLNPDDDDVWSSVVLPSRGRAHFDVGSSDDWMKAMVAVSAVVTTGFVVVGLGAMPGGSTTNNLFNRLSRLSACASSLEVLRGGLTKLIEELLDYVRVSWFGYDSRLLNEWKRFDDWCEGVARLRDCDFENAARLDPKVKIEVERLIEQQETWQKQMSQMRFPDAQRARFTCLSMFLEKARVACALSGAGEHHSRAPATIFHFVGGTGIGKSEMLNMLNAFLLANHGYTDPSDLATKVYYRDATQQRWDGYTNRVQGVVWDDFGMVKDTLANPSKEPPELVRADNGAPWQLEMANLSEKANTYFQAKWVLLTSNQSTFKWDSLTNGEAVARRITKKFRQTVNEKYAMTRVIDGTKCVVLDVARVTECAALDDSVYEDVWRFQEIDPTNLSADARDLPVGSLLTFAEMATLVCRTVKSRHAAAAQKLGHVTKYFERCVQVASKGPAQSDLEMVRDADPAIMTPLECPAEALQQVVDEELVRDRERSVAWVASSPEEFAEKARLASNYLFGGNGGGPTGSRPADFTRLSGVHGRAPPPQREDLLTHLANLRIVDETWTEWLTGRVHLNLAKIVARAPVEPGILPTSQPDDMFDAVPLLQATCVSVPKRKAAMFIDTFSSAYLTLIAAKAATGVETARENLLRGLHFDAGMLDVFNAQMWCGYGRLDDVELCCEHGDPDAKIRSAFALLARGERVLIDMCDWMKMTVSSFVCEIKFIAIRTLLIVVLTMALGSLFSWLAKRRKEQRANQKNEKRRKNAESAPERTSGARRGEVESRQEVTSGAKQTNVESAQDRTAGSRRGVVEASFDQNAKELEVKIARSTYALWWKRDGVENKIGIVFFIAGRVALTNRHIASVLDRGTVRLVNQDYARSFEIPVASLKTAFLSEDSVHGYKDVALIEFPRSVMLHADLRRHFMTREDFSLHVELRQVGLYTVSAEGHLEVRYSGMCRAEDRKLFELICPGQEERRVRDWYAYAIPTKVGDCGGLVCSHDPAFERKFVGIHMAGTHQEPWSAIAVAVHSGVIAELESKLVDRAPEALDCNDVEAPTSTGVTQHRPFDGEYTLLGGCPPVHENVRTEIVPSPVASDIERAFGPPLTKPAMLCPHGENDPLEKARQKAFTPGVHLEEAVLDDCVNNYAQTLEANSLKTDQRVLTHEEAIAGVEGDPFYSGIKRNTSCGYGWPKSGVGKKAFLGEGEYVFDHPEVVGRVDEMLSRLRAGKRTGTIWTDTLKDERRNIPKVDAGKTRLFSAGELAYLIVFRRYFAGFAAHMTRNRVTVESCVGVNVFGFDWTRVAETLRRHGPHVVAGDFTNYDGSLAAQLLWRCLDMINAWYGGTAEENFIRRRLWCDIVHSVHVTKGVLYMWNHSQPSGCPITAILNSLYHSLAARYVYVLCARKYCPDMVALSNFNANVSHVNYGDDDVYNIGEQIIEWYNQITMAEMFVHIGMTYTDELKSGQMVRSRTLAEIQFLKRKFRWDANQNRFRAPLTLDTITEMARWVKGKRNHWQLTAETLEAALMESAEHDRETFLRVSKGLATAIRRTQVRTPLVLSSFREYQEKALQKCYI